jgi:hypothetical protein
MRVQTVTYHGRTVGAATRDRFFLTERLRRRPETDPQKTFVIYMCAYARDVLTGRVPGPYSEVEARRYARACLIPDELLERPALDVPRAAEALGVPEAELHFARSSEA